MSTVYADPMAPVAATILGMRRETADTFTMKLQPPVRPGGFTFAPGQFNMVSLFGVGEVPISISGDPEEPGELVHTVRAVGTVTRSLRHLRPGATVGIRGPFGSAWPIEAAKGKDVIIVAGGIGLAPLRPAFYHLLRHRADYGRVILAYGARSTEELLYVKEFERWRGRFDVVALVTVDRGGPDWHGYVGVVTTLLPKVQFDAANAVAMVCGPEVMMRFTVRELKSRGLADPAICLSMERNMKCGVGFCGHCQYGPTFVCKDGPVFRFDRIAPFLWTREL